MGHRSWVDDRNHEWTIYYVKLFANTSLVLQIKFPGSHIPWILRHKSHLWLHAVHGGQKWRFGLKLCNECNNSGCGFLGSQKDIFTHSPPLPMAGMVCPRHWKLGLKSPAEVLSMLLLRPSGKFTGPYPKSLAAFSFRYRSGKGWLKATGSLQELEVSATGDCTNF